MSPFSIITFHSDTSITIVFFSLFQSLVVPYFLVFKETSPVHHKYSADKDFSPANSIVPANIYPAFTNIISGFNLDNRMHKLQELRSKVTVHQCNALHARLKYRNTFPIFSLYLESSVQPWGPWFKLFWRNLFSILWWSSWFPSCRFICREIDHLGSCH